MPIAAISSLFDYIVGPADQTLWDIQPKHLGGLQVDTHLDFSGLLYRQVRTPHKLVGPWSNYLNGEVYPKGAVADMPFQPIPSNVA